MTYKIYKIVGYGLTYYGSTKVDLKSRKSKHLYDTKKYLSGKGKYVSSCEIIKQGDDWDIKLVEDNINKDELLHKEGVYMKNNECVNKRIAGRTKKEFYQENKEEMRKKFKEFYQKNKEEIRRKYKEFYQENKDEINEKRRIKMASIENKEKKALQDKKYREKNKDKLKQSKANKVKCPHCEKEICKGNINRHIKNIHK